MARNSDSEALPKTSMARSNMSKWKRCVSTLRITTPLASAQMKVGSSIQVPLVQPLSRSAAVRQAANMARVSIAT